MKKTTFLTSTYFAIFLFLLTMQSMAQVVVPFTQRASVNSPDRKIYNIRGDFTMMGNINLTLANYRDNANNNNNDLIFVDVDNDNST